MSSQLLPSLGLLVLGIAVGTYGTLVGAGGGFALVPALIFLFPLDSPAQITSISLAVVCANAATGSLSYFKLKRVDYRSGRLLAVATIPGAVVGSILVAQIPRNTFHLIMGLALVLVGGFLTLRPRAKHPLLLGRWLTVTRNLVDSKGNSYSYRFNLALALVISAGVGLVSSLLGIGGGIIHVPVLTTFFNFPEHVATATSLFVLMFTSGAAVTTHIFQSDYPTALPTVIPLTGGVLIGAPLGAAVSHRFSGSLIIRLLALALGLVGLRLLFG